MDMQCLQIIGQQNSFKMRYVFQQLNVIKLDKSEILDLTVFGVNK